MDFGTVVNEDEDVFAVCLKGIHCGSVKYCMPLFYAIVI